MSVLRQGVEVVDTLGLSDVSAGVLWATGSSGCVQ